MDDATEILATLDDADSMTPDQLRSEITRALAFADGTDLIHLAKPLRVILARVSGVRLVQRPRWPLHSQGKKSSRKDAAKMDMSSVSDEFADQHEDRHEHRKRQQGRRREG